MAYCMEKFPEFNHVLRFGRLYKRDSIDVFITTTPNKTAEKLFLRYGAKKIPIKNYNENLFQILNVDLMTQAKF